MRLAIWSVVGGVFVVVVVALVVWTDPIRFYRDEVTGTVSDIRSEIRRVEQAQEACQRRHDRDQKYDAAFNAGETAMNERRYEDAIQHFDEAIAVKDYAHDPYCRTADCLNELERYQETLEVTSIALARYAGCSWMHCSRGKAFGRLEQYPEAIEAYENALLHDSNSLRAHNNLGWLLAGCLDEQWIDGPKALHHAQHAQALFKAGVTSPDNYESILHALMGAAASRNDDFETAISETEVALSMGPESEKERLTRNLEKYRQGIPYQREPEETVPQESESSALTE